MHETAAVAGGPGEERLDRRLHHRRRLRRVPRGAGRPRGDHPEGGRSAVTATETHPTEPAPPAEAVGRTGPSSGLAAVLLVAGAYTVVRRDHALGRVRRPGRAAALPLRRRHRAGRALGAARRRHAPRRPARGRGGRGRRPRPARRLAHRGQADRRPGLHHRHRRPARLGHLGRRCSSPAPPGRSAARPGVRDVSSGVVLSVVSWYGFFVGLGIPLTPGILDGIL